MATPDACAIAACGCRSAWVRRCVGGAAIVPGALAAARYPRQDVELVGIRIAKRPEVGRVVRIRLTA
jgi:hypothetical protein